MKPPSERRRNRGHVRMDVSLPLHLSSSSFLLLLLLCCSPPSSSSVDAIDLSKEGTASVRYRIDEEINPGTVVGNVFEDSGLSGAYPADVSSRFAFHVLAQRVPYFFFRLESNTSRLIVASRLDREDPRLDCRGRPSCEIRFDAAITPAEFFRTLTVVVEVVDVNDNAPTFKEEAFELKISESTPIGSSFALPTASDPDNPMYGVQRYLVQPDLTDALKLLMSVRADGAVEASLSVDGHLDRETAPIHEFTLLACESTVRPRCGSLKVKVEVLDSNDNAPTFERDSYQVNVSESIAPGSTILTVRATDSDSDNNGRVTYELSEVSAQNHGDVFSLDPNSGRLTAVKPLDRETTSVYRMVVIARDRGADPLHSEVPVTIYVDDENDNAPVITTYTISLVPLGEHLDDYKDAVYRKKFFSTPDLSPLVSVVKFEENLPMGSFIVGIGAQDRDTEVNNRVDCTQNHPLLKLVKDSTGHERLSVSYRLLSDAVFDAEDFYERDELPIITTVVTCRDVPENPEVPSLASNTTVHVYITDANDRAPRFDRTTYGVDRGTINDPKVRRGEKPLFVVDASDADLTKRNSRIFYALDSLTPSDNEEPFVNVGSSSGEVYLGPSVDPSLLDGLTLLCLVVNATDAGGPALSSSSVVSLVVDAPEDANQLIFASNAYRFAVEENLDASPVAMTPVGRVVATDVRGNCRDPPRDVVYRIEAGIDDGGHLLPFVVDEDTGTVLAVESLDREQRAVYSFEVSATRKSRGWGDPATIRTSVTVRVIDLDDNAPVFVNLTTKTDFVRMTSPDAVFGSTGSHVIFLSPDHPLDEPLFKVSAKDADENAENSIRYAVKSYDATKDLHMNPETGELHLRSKGGRERTLREVVESPIVVDVVASDSGSSKMAARSKSRIVVVLNDTSSIKAFKERFIELKNSRDPFSFDRPLASKTSPHGEGEGEGEGEASSSGLALLPVLLVIGILAVVAVACLSGMAILVLRSKRRARKRQDKLSQAFVGGASKNIFAYRESSDVDEKVSEHLVDSSFDFSSHHSFNLEPDLAEDYLARPKHSDHVTTVPINVHHCHPHHSGFHPARKGSHARFATLDRPRNIHQSEYPLVMYHPRTSTTTLKESLRPFRTLKTSATSLREIKIGHE